MTGVIATACIDLDDSGTIELRELEAFCAPCLLGDGARQSSAQQSRITELFAQVDTDGSGVISFDEFCVLVKGSLS